MILLYHSVLPDDSPPERFCAGQALPLSVFERQIRWLVNRHRIVSLAEYVTELQRSGLHNRMPISISFDDGFGSTFQCASPFLAEMNIPATIFVTTGHIEPGELLWFSYLKALCFEGLYTIVKVASRTIPLEKIEQRKRAWDELRIMAKTSGAPLKFL